MLIITKFHIPDFGNSQIKRKRLIDQLDQNKNCKIIMVTAPAGYGKTSLLSSWALGVLKKQKVTWLSLDEEDNDEELFWSYFLWSFYKNTWVPGEMKQKAEKLFRNAVPFSKLYLTYFINDITEIGIQITMVLDDFRAIRNTKIINNLEFLIRHLPSNAQLIMSGREHLDIDFAKYKVSGQVFVLTGKDLSFTQQETLSFFCKEAHINLTQEEYAGISHTFEGWIAGMQLLAMTVKKSEKLTIPQITGNDLIYTFLMEEVLNRLDDNIKNFLLETSVLEQFCPELCDFLLDTENAGETIRKLEASSLFLACVEKKDGWFRYHKIFRDFLQSLIQEDKEKCCLSIYQKAVKWYEAKGYWRETIHYAIKGQDYDKAVCLIEGLSSFIGCMGESRLLHNWNQYLPKEMVQNSLRLLLNSAWAYSAEGNTSKLFWCLKELRKFETIPMQQQIELTALYSTNLAGPHAELDTVLMECKEVLNLLTPKEFLMQLICFNIGSILLLKGSVEECLSYFEQCYINSMESGNFYLAVISMKAITTSWIRNGWLQKTEREILKFLNVLADEGGDVIPAAGLLYAQLAEIYYQRNELDEALDMAIKGSKYGEFGGDVWTTGENKLLLEKIYRAMNHKKQSEMIKAEMLMCLKGKSLFDLKMKMECYHAQTLIMEGKLTLASRRISSMEEMADPKLNLVYPELAFVKSRFYVSKGNLKKAEDTLHSLKKEAKTYGQKGLLCEVQVFLATIHEKMGNCLQALNELEEAVSLAEVQGNFRFFLDEGDLMEGMLKRLAKKSGTETAQSIFMEGLLCCFKMSPVISELSGEVLSGREIQILKLVAQGAGNEEIADKLYISKNTVKTHLLNIYTKLGVHSRAKAVAKADALNIIS